MAHDPDEIIHVQYDTPLDHKWFLLEAAHRYIEEGGEIPAPYSTVGNPFLHAAEAAFREAVGR